MMGRSVRGSVVLLLLVLWGGPAEALHAQVTDRILSGHSTGAVEATLPGEYLTLTPPEGTSLRPFFVPAHNGRIRMGMLSAPVQRGQLGSAELNARMRGLFIERSSHQLFLDLLALGENREVLTRENLLGLYRSGRNTGTVVPGADAWPGLLIWSARGVLADDAYREVFCVEDVPCPIDVYSGPRPFDIGARNRAGGVIWGNATNEFRFRAAYETFVNSYIEQIVEWGASLPREAAYVSTVQMPSYDFNRGAYILRLSAGGPGILPEGRPLEVRTDAYDLDIRLKPASREIASVVLTWKLDRAGAEALRTSLQERGVNQLFLKVDGLVGFMPLDRVAMQSPLALEQTPVFEFTGDSFDLFYDVELTEPVESFPIGG